MNFIISWLTSLPVWGFLGGVLTGMTALFVHYKFSPAMQLRLQARWIDAERIILHIEVENKSRVVVKKNCVKLQILEYPAGKKSLTEWVPFETDKVHTGEDSEFWRDPVELFQSNHRLYPGEILAIDRMECLSAKDRLFHVGLQFKSKSSISFIRFRFLGHNEQWTTTAIYVR